MRVRPSKKYIAANVQTYENDGLEKKKSVWKK